MSEQHTNWAGNYTYQARGVQYPETIEELQELVVKSEKIKALGSRHSFNDIADTSSEQVSLSKLPIETSFDHERKQVSFGAGLTYGQLCPQIHEQGYALHNLASLPHISVVGSVATATHGSGDSNGNLAVGVTALEFVSGTGELVSLSRETNPDIFDGVVVHLGALGIVTKMTLELQPTFWVQQEVYDRLPLSELYAHFDAIESSAYSVSLFSDWHSDYVKQIWFKRRLSSNEGLEIAPTFHGASLAQQQRHPVDDAAAVSVTAQRGIPGPWHERLPHFRIDQTPSVGAEIQSEYFVPRKYAVEAYKALTALGDQIRPVLLISEVRTVAADNLWMSTAYQQPMVGFHFTWERDWDGVKARLPLIEAALEPFECRPHWGKTFTMAPERIRSFYPKLAEFRALAERFDPQGKLRNAYLDKVLFS
jgi:xylitol oxidase